MSAFFHTVDTFMWVGLGTLALLLYFMAHSARQSHDNPLRIALSAVVSRVVVTLGLGLIDIPATIAVEPVGAVMDIASVVYLTYYYATGVRQMLAAFDPPKSLPPPV